ncbi:MAG: hypothetical protein PHW69_01805 [Elusimicrobiaceae bacterium]|nr:hypothetical protein [Elusimicrobiaceae bacterium]
MVRIRLFFITLAALPGAVCAQPVQDAVQSTAAVTVSSVPPAGTDASAGAPAAAMQTVSGINAVSTAPASAAPAGPSARALRKIRAEQEAEFREDRERTSYEKLLLQGDLEPSEEGKLPFYTQALGRWRPGYGKKLKGQLFEKRGAVYAHMKDWNRAASDLRWAIAANPKALDAAKLLSRIYQLQGKCAKSEHEISRALKLCGKSERAELYYQRALLYGLCFHNNDKAFADFDQAIKTAYPARHASIMRKSFLNRGVLYCLRGNSAEGLADIDEAKIMGGADNRDYMAAQGSCQFMQKAFTAALADYAGYLDPEDASHTPPATNITAEVYGRRGQIELNNGQTDAALADFNKCISIRQAKPDINRPSNENLFDPSDCYFYRAMLYELLDDAAAALQDYDDACDMGNRAACEKRKLVKTPI